MFTQANQSDPSKVIASPCWYLQEYDIAIPMELKPDSSGYLFDPKTGENGRGTRHGIQWEFEGRVIRIRRHQRRVYGYPSPAMDKVVVIYPPDDKQFPAPRNLVVYNPDGSVHVRADSPMTIAPESVWPHSPPGPAACFYFLGWTTYNGELVMMVHLDMGRRDAIETRKFNPYTGECEDLLYTWKL